MTKETEEKMAAGMDEMLKGIRYLVKREQEREAAERRNMDYIRMTRNVPDDGGLFGQIFGNRWK